MYNEMSPISIYLQSIKNTHTNLPMMYTEEEIAHGTNTYLQTHVVGKSKEYEVQYEYIYNIIPEFM